MAEFGKEMTVNDLCLYCVLFLKSLCKDFSLYVTAMLVPSAGLTTFSEN